jgi:hypothetical protein
MGASVNMAKGASDAGIRYAIGVIGDSTFLHSGITPLIDAVSMKTPMTLVILDNSIVAMTGCQETMVPSERLPEIVKGIGVEEDHIVLLEARKTNHEENVNALRREMEQRPYPAQIPSHTATRGYNYEVRYHSRRRWGTGRPFSCRNYYKGRSFKGPCRQTVRSPWNGPARRSSPCSSSHK